MEDIASGVYSPGERLESVREYAGRVGVNANTAMRAYSWLQEQDMIYNKRGIGYFVSEEAPRHIREAVRKDFFDKEAPYFMKRLASFGVTPEELQILYSQYLSEL